MPDTPTEPAKPFSIGGERVAPGATASIALHVSALGNRMDMPLNARVFHGARPGPVLFVSAAVHGDEINGVEICRRLVQRPSLAELSGTLIVIPVVNGYGFMARSRYLPDRRDLNRTFPGSEKGSLAGRLARIFLDEIVDKADYGIDLHSAAIHRANLPQIRVSPGDARMMELAKVFGAPAIITSAVRDGSLRKAAADRGVPVLLYEAGEGLRFDEMAVRAGLAGILRVMKHLGMLEGEHIEAPGNPPFLARKSHWLRAPEGGLLRLNYDLGDVVEAGAVAGTVSDMFGDEEHALTADIGGIVIGRVTLPIVHEGDAVLHIARADTPEAAGSKVDGLVGQLEDAAMFYEDEII